MQISIDTILAVFLSFAAGTLMFYLSLGASDYLNERMMLEEAELHRLADSRLIKTR